MGEGGEEGIKGEGRVYIEFLYRENTSQINS